MTGLDTSVVIRLLVGEPVDQAAKAKDLLDALFAHGEQACVSDLVVSEVYFALQYHYGVSKAKAIAALRAMFDGGEVVGTGAAPNVLSIDRLASAKPGLVDRLIHQGYRMQHQDMATFEKQAKKLEGVLVL